jgi:endonuclease YncB( thermonuclease family)
MGSRCYTGVYHLKGLFFEFHDVIQDYRSGSMRILVPGIIFTLLVVAAIPKTARANTATMEEVLQGDRIKIKGWEIVRLTGILAPKPDEPFGEKALLFAKGELEGKLVKIATYTTDNTAEGIVRDAEGLCMIQIEYGGEAQDKKEESGSKSSSVDFNALMLEKGLARIDEEYLPDWLQHYREIENEAKKKKLGIWSVKEE